MTTSDYFVRNLPASVPWWRLISRYRWRKIVRRLTDVFLCPSCAVTLSSEYKLPCGSHQNEYERDVAMGMIAFRRLVRTHD